MKRTSTILTFLFLLIANSPLYAQSSWTQLSNFSGSARYSAVSFVLNDIAYIGTGKSETANHNDFWSYDPATDSWTQVASLPGAARQSATAFTLSGKGYVGTGQNGSIYYNDFYAYDPIDNTWAAILPFPGTERYGAVSFTIEGKAYVGTGRDDISGAVGDFYTYDPIDDSWAPIAGTEARQGAAAFAINGKGYIASGISYNGGSFQKSDVQEYDPVTNSWTEKIFADTKLSAKHNAVAVTLNNKAYILGGNSSSTVVIYDPADNSLSTGNTFSDIDRRANPVAFLANGDIYTGLGYVNMSSTYRNDIWKLEAPKAPAAPTNLEASYEMWYYGRHTKVNVTFKDNSDNEEGFLLYQSTDDGVTYMLLESFNPCTNCSNNWKSDNPTELKTYYFKSAAFNSIDTVFTEPVEVQIPLRKPLVLTTTNISDYYVGLRVCETPSSISKNFVIERALASDGKFSPIDTVTEAVIVKEVIDFNVKAGETYEYFVYGITPEGLKSPTTDTLQITTAEMSPWEPVGLPYQNHYSNFLFKRGDSLYTGAPGPTFEFSAVEINTGKVKQKKPMPFRGHDFDSFVIDDMGYVAGGFINGEPSDTLWQYSFKEDSWKILSFYPGDGGYMFSFVIEGVFYIGNTLTNEFYSYSPQTGQWQALPNAPARVASPSRSTEFNGKGYVLSDNKLLEYNPGTKEWVQLIDFGKALFHQSRLLATKDGLYILTNEELLQVNFKAGTTVHIAHKVWGPDIYSFRHFTKGNSIFLYTGYLHDSYDKKILWQLNLGTPVAPYKFEVAQLRIDEGENEVSLSWQDGSHKETAYLIERKTEKSNFHILDTLDANSISYTDSTVLDDTPYTYRLTAINEMGRGGSKEASILTEYIPLNGVADLKATIDNTFTISLHWDDNSNGEKNYVIERLDKTKGTSFILDTLAANSTTFQEVYFQEGHKLLYEVISVSSKETLSQTVETNTPLFAPKQVLFDSTGMSSGAIILNWQNVSELDDAIVIERSSDSQNFSEIARVPATESTYADASAEVGVVYQYRIYASDGNGLRSAYSTAIFGVTTAVDKEPKSKFQIYPNPASSFLTIRGMGAEPVEEISLWSAAGVKVRLWKMERAHGDSHRLELGELAGGLYFLQINTLKRPILKKLYIR